jgi:glycosyltransferase involved in cell wall biosynthesis
MQEQFTSAAIQENVNRPGAITRSVRNVLLLASNAFGGTAWKNIALGLNVLRDRKARAIWRRHFDADWYRETHTDIAQSGVSPFLHYLLYGQAEGRAASAEFDSRFYLQRHPDVREAGVNPLLHYAAFGVHERRTTVSPSTNMSGPREGQEFRSFHPAAEPGTTLVTIVIPCFNYGSYLSEALESVQRQTLGQIDVIVVEGGSTDGVTPQTVRDLERSWSPRVRFFYRSEPHLAGNNRNFGISRATTKYVCCLDPDDQIKPTYLEAAIFLGETYGYHLVSPSVQAFGGDDFMWQLADADPKTILEFNQVSTVALYRRDAWSEVQGYRDFGRSNEYVAEDWEFWVRVLRAGFRAKCIPEALHIYRVHNAGLWFGERSSVDYQRTKIDEANRELLAREPVLRPLTPQPDAWRALLQPQSSDRAILFALPFVATGGAEKIFEAIIRSETAKGRKVIVITTLVLADTIKDAAEHFRTLTPYFYSLPALFGEHPVVWDDFISYLIDQYSVDLILIAGCDYMYHALPAFTRAFPHIGIVDQLFNDKVHFPTNRHYAEYIDVTIVPTPAFEKRIVQEFAEERERAAVIPHGVEIPDTSEINLVDARRKGGLPASWNDSFVVGFFGRMSPEKAPADFVEIAQKLKTERNMRFVMTGEGPELKRVMDLIQRYDLSDRLFAPGFVNDPRELMTAVDVVVVPSRLDGMPLVVMEAQALGKPVVASDVGSIPAMIADGVTGLLCSAGDIPTFVNTIRELQNSPDKRIRLGNAARKWAERTHSAEAMVRRYEETFGRARTMRQKATRREER